MSNEIFWPIVLSYCRIKKKTHERMIWCVVDDEDDRDHADDDDIGEINDEIFYTDRFFLLLVL